MSNGVIITGKSTGETADINEINLVKSSVKIPVLVGSGITDKNILNYYNIADGFIIGSYFKKDGNWKNEPDKDRIKKLVSKIKK